MKRLAVLTAALLFAAPAFASQCYKPFRSLPRIEDRLEDIENCQKELDDQLHKLELRQDEFDNRLFKLELR